MKTLYDQSQSFSLAHHVVHPYWIDFVGKRGRDVCPFMARQPKNSHAALPNCTDTWYPNHYEMDSPSNFPLRRANIPRRLLVRDQVRCDDQGKKWHMHEYHGTAVASSSSLSIAGQYIN